jgi:hypothetical protein
LGIAGVRNSRSGTYTWKLIGASDSQLRSRFKDSGSSDARIIVLNNCGADQRAQLLVLKNVPPLLVSKRSELRWRGFR